MSLRDMFKKNYGVIYMKLNFDIIKNKSAIVLAALLVLSAFISIGCISASDVSAGPILDDDGNFLMSVPYNCGTGYHWEVSSDSYGVDLVSHHNEIDHQGVSGSSAMAYFTFHVNSDDYCAKLVLLSPSGDVVKEVDSNMLN